MFNLRDVRVGYTRHITGTKVTCPQLAHCGPTSFCAAGGSEGLGNVPSQGAMLGKTLLPPSPATHMPCLPVLLQSNEGQLGTAIMNHHSLTHCESLQSKIKLHLHLHLITAHKRQNMKTVFNKPVATMVYIIYQQFLQISPETRFFTCRHQELA